MDSNAVFKEIVKKIIDLFAEEVGPVASLLAEESLKFWVQKLKSHDQKPGLRNIYVFVNHLALSIDDQESKQRFIDEVYSIESLKMLKKRSTTS